MSQKHLVLLGITLPISLLEKIDSKRGDIPRSMYTERAIENYLKSKGSGRSKRIHWRVMGVKIKL
jgi:metal-responsive CopG/Arc/MetJ family transcriptional regulator